MCTCGKFACYTGGLFIVLRGVQQRSPLCWRLDKPKVSTNYIRTHLGLTRTTTLTITKVSRAANNPFVIKLNCEFNLMINHKEKLPEINEIFNLCHETPMWPLFIRYRRIKFGKELL